MAPWPGFIGGSDAQAALIGSNADTINWYVEGLAAGGANRAALLPTPGFIPWGTAVPPGLGGVRALFFLPQTRLFAVIGPTLWEFTYNGVPTNRGPVGDDGVQAQIIYNSVLGGQLGIVSAGGVYSFDLATNVLSGPYLTGGYTHLAYANNTGLALNPTTGKVNLSALNNLTGWNAGQFFQRSLFADAWAAMFVDQNNLVWLLGDASFEVWYFTGQGTQPFAPLSGLNGQLGIVGPWAFTVAQAGNAWVARNVHGLGLLMETHGGPPTVLSSRGVASTFHTAAHQSARALYDTELLTHQFGKHVFTAATLPVAGATWVYDHLEQAWARWGKWNPATGQYDVWAPRVHALAFGQDLVGARTSGQLAAMDPTYPRELDGAAIRRLRRAPALVSEKRRAPIDQLEILMDVGLGIQAGQGAPPEVLLRVSDDGGRTWSNELRASTGAAGAWRQRVYWTRLGLFNDAVAELTYSDPVPAQIVDAYVNNLEAG